MPFWQESQCPYVMDLAVKAIQKPFIDNVTLDLIDNVLINCIGGDWSNNSDLSAGQADIDSQPKTVLID